MNFDNNKIIVGLTGGIASGKSRAAEMFSAAGAYIIDTDIIASQVSEEKEIKAKLYKAFPSAFECGILVRSELRKIVFGNAEKLKLLNSIMHPAIKRCTLEQIESSGAAVNVVVAPLLFEAGFDDITSLDITVNCPAEIRIERLMRRDNISEELAENMIDSQLSDAERTAKADIAVENSGSLAQLRAQVFGIYENLCDGNGRSSLYPNR